MSDDDQSCSRALPLVPLLITTSLGHVFSSVNTGKGRGGGQGVGRQEWWSYTCYFWCCRVLPDRGCGGVRAARNNRLSSLNTLSGKYRKGRANKKEEKFRMSRGERDEKGARKEWS